MLTSLRGAAAPAVLAAGLVLAGAAHADLVDVQFGQSNTGLVGTVPTPSYSGAAVLGAAGDQWNLVTGPFNKNGPFGQSASGLPLVDATGAASAVTLSFTTTDGFVNVGNFAPIFKGTTFANLLDSFLFTDGQRVKTGAQHDGPGTVTLSGLTPNGSYELILYSVADSIGRTSVFTVDGAVQDVTPSGTKSLTKGDNFAEFLATADAGGTLAVTLSAGTTGSFAAEADLNGLQLLELAVPEPGTLLLLATGLIGCAAARRRATAPDRTRRP